MRINDVCLCFFCFIVIRICINVDLIVPLNICALSRLVVLCCSYIIYKKVCFLLQRDIIIPQMMLSLWLLVAGDVSFSLVRIGDCCAAEKVKVTGGRAFLLATSHLIQALFIKDYHLILNELDYFTVTFFMRTVPSERVSRTMLMPLCRVLVRVPFTVKISALTTPTPFISSMLNGLPLGSSALLLP